MRLAAIYGPAWDLATCQPVHLSPWTPAEWQPCPELGKQSTDHSSQEVHRIPLPLVPGHKVPCPAPKVCPSLLPHSWDPALSSCPRQVLFHQRLARECNPVWLPLQAAAGTPHALPLWSTHTASHLSTYYVLGTVPEAGRPWVARSPVPVEPTPSHRGRQAGRQSGPAHGCTHSERQSHNPASRGPPGETHGGQRLRGQLTSHPNSPQAASPRTLTLGTSGGS